MLSKNIRRAKNIVLFRNPIILYRLPGFTRHVDHCPVCGGTGTFIHKNLYTALERCDSCSHVYARQQPRRHILSLLYEDKDFWELDRSHQGIHEVDYGPHWEEYLNARIGAMDRAGFLTEPAQRFYEIGCSEGILLKELTDRGHHAEGCEMNPTIARMGREKLGVTIHNCTFEEFTPPEAPFDRIIAFHTLEHLNDPHVSLQKMVRMLREEGSLLVEVPTGAEDFNNIYHVHFFEPHSLRSLLGKYFEEIDILENQFSNPDGSIVKSLYGVARQPRSIRNTDLS